MSVSPAGVLQGNLFPVADSDFESGLSGNWSAATNCTLSASTLQSFTGTHALAAQATTTATLTFTYAPVPVTAGAGYTHSWWAYAPVNSVTAQMSVVYKNSGGGTVGTATLTSYSLTNGSWIPAADHLLPPAGAVTATFTMTVTGLSATRDAYFDLFYTAPTLCQVLVALTTPPLSTSPQFADMTPWVRENAGLTWNHGRADETSTVQPGAGTWTADNTLGWFAQGNANSPFPFAVGQRTRLNFADETGAFHTLFDGYITDDPVTWQGPAALESSVTFSCQDLLSWLGRENTLRTMLEQEQLYDQPLCLYTLADASGSVTASDSSGNAAPPLAKHKYGSASSSAKFGSSQAVVGPIGGVFGITASTLTSCLFTSATPFTGNTQLEAALATPVSASAGFAFEAWYALTSSTDVAMVPVSVANKQSGASLSVLLNSSTSQARLAYYPARGGTPSFSSALSVSTGGMAIVSVSGTTATLYYDGSSGPVTLTMPAAFTANYLTVGGFIGGAVANDFGDFNGAVNCVAVYPSTLSTGRVAAHASAGLNDNWGGTSAGTTISNLISNTLRYAGIPSAFITSMPAGVSYPDAYETSGQTPLGMIQLYQQADGGVFYCAANGKLTWQDRAARYAAQVTPALVLTTGQYEPLPIGGTTQYMINDATFGNNAIPGGVRAVNPAGQATNGTYTSGQPGSPTTAPWFSYSQSLTNTPSADVLGDAASWAANIYGSAFPRSPSVTMDLATLGAPFSRAAAFACDVGSVTELQGLPPTGPGGTRANYLMVEGVSGSYARSGGALAWTLSFNTSPAPMSAAWIAGDANLGVLDSTAVVGLGTDGETNGSGIQHVGPPYPVPAFSTSMNRTGSVGANDLRGLAYNVQQEVTPPVFTAQQVTAAQNIPNNAATDVTWDTAWYDTATGFGPSGDLIQWTCLVAGLYELMACIPFGANATGDRRAYFQQNGAEVGGRASTSAVIAGDYVSLAISCTVDCQVGDTLKVTCFQNSGGPLAIVTTNGGAVWSGVWIAN